jgi:hypothetical protein
MIDEVINTNRIAKNMESEKRRVQMKKKLIAALLAGTMLMGMLVGCGSGEGNVSDAAENDEKVAQGTEEKSEDLTSENVEEESAEMVVLHNYYTGKDNYIVSNGDEVTVIDNSIFGTLSERDNVCIDQFSDGYAVVHKNVFVDSDVNDDEDIAYNYDSYKYIINTEGEVVSEFGLEYSLVDILPGGYALVWKKDEDGNYEDGIINIKGEVVVELGEYDINGFDKDGLNVVKNKNEEYGVINTKGDVVVGFGIYNQINSFGCGGLLVEKDGKYGVINTKGEVIVELGTYDSIDNFDKNGVAVVKKDDKYGVINAKGDVVIEFGKYDKIERVDFFTGYLEAYKDNKHYAINTTGKVVVDFDKYDGIVDFSDDCAVVVCYGEDENGEKSYSFRKFGIVTTDGKVVVELGEYVIGEISNGMVWVENSEGPGVINTKGKIIVEPGTYDFISNFDENGVAVVKKDGKCGVINTEGEVVVEPDTYDFIGYLQPTYYFYNGYSFAKKSDGSYDIINTKGEIIYQETE